jgi:EAL domain-containing protein (putative c-di-GMP-specific phosphodiesterase class I)
MSTAWQTRSTDAATWYLQGHVRSDESMRRFNISRVPFQIGRLPNLSLSLDAPAVSKVHAEIDFDGRQLRVRDLGSTNGTYVNGQRIEGDSPLCDGDLLQLANIVFRVGVDRQPVNTQTVQGMAIDSAQTLIRFDRLMSEKAVVPFFQPLVRLSAGGACGYEVLGRSFVEGLETPGKMFAAAAQLSMECELSSLLRDTGILHGTRLPEPMSLFVNTHPAEMGTPGLIASLMSIRRQVPERPIVVEIHEAAVTSAAAMQEFHAVLRDLNMRLAYDDFGAGQARLVELTEVPPDFVKFDINLVRNIHVASPRRRQLLAALVEMVREQGITAVAEGIENAGEAKACRELSFDLAQGYYFGRPAPIEAVVNAGESGS